MESAEITAEIIAEISAEITAEIIGTGLPLGIGARRYICPVLTPSRLVAALTSAVGWRLESRPSSRLTPGGSRAAIGFSTRGQSVPSSHWSVRQSRKKVDE